MDMEASWDEVKEAIQYLSPTAHMELQLGVYRNRLEHALNRIHELTKDNVRLLETIDAMSVEIDNRNGDKAAADGSRV